MCLGPERYGKVLVGDKYYPYGKVLREYKPCGPNRYLSTYHERDAETGYDNRGARLYDNEIGRFLGVDPLANHPNQRSMSSYQYVWGNPVSLTDPDGECPWCLAYAKKAATGAAAGALFEAGTQVIVGMASGQTFTEAVDNIDLVDVGAAAIEGAATGGGSVRKKAFSLGGKILKRGLGILTSEAVQASADYTVGGKVDVIGSENSKKSVSSVITNTTVGTIAGGAGEATGAVMGAVTNKTNKELTKARKRWGRKQAGSRGDRLARQNVSRLTRTAAANSVVSEVAPASVTETIKAKAEVQEDN